ncbi:MAG: MopE-related protein [Myxococcota bacterium]
MSSLLVLSLFACDGGKDDSGDTAPDTDPPLVDADGDGVPEGADCDDADPDTYPGAREAAYDGVDQDCDGVDVNDVDGDGFVGEAGGGDDCNDSNPEVHPGAAVVCYNLLDETCVGVNWSQYDCDADGFELSADCADEDPTINPGAADAWYDGVDSDCDGEDDFDQDADGEPTVASGGTDCDDLDPTINAAAVERWDGLDNDCVDGIDALTTFHTSGRWFGDDTAGDAAFGAAFAPLGDLDGDGRLDMLVGVPGYDDDRGRAYVLPYAAGLEDPAATALASITGDTGAYLGAAVSAVEGPGGRLVVIGGPGSRSVFLFDVADLTGGAALATTDAVATITADLYFLGGDLAPWADAAGTPSLLVSSFEVTDGGGYLGLFPGAALTGSLTTDAAAWSVDTTGDLYDTTVLGDLDGDGIHEIGVATSGFEANPRTYLYPGADVAMGDTTGPSLSGFTGHLLLAGAPDLDGDGYDELLVSDWEADGGGAAAGKVWVVGGPAALVGGEVAAQAFATVSGVTDLGALRAASSHADLDGDSVVDLLVCAPGDGLSAIVGACGWVAGPDLVAGGDHAPGAGRPTFTSEGADDLFGQDARFDDADGDGDADLWISAPTVPGGLMVYLRE